MKTKRLLLAWLLVCLLPLAALADVWQDPETKVNYGYSPGSGVAQVLRSGDIEGDVVILPRITIDGTEYVVTTNERYAFSGNGALRSISIPGTIEFVQFYTFQDCSSLSSVQLGEGTSGIGDYCFYRTQSLKNIVLPSSLYNISYHAFCESALDSITVPDGITWFGRYNFKNCRNLKKVVLPAVSTFRTDWGGHGYCRNFENCIALEEVVCRSSVPPTILDNPFMGVDLSKVMLYVPKGTKEQYQSASIWNDFKDIVEIDIDTGPTLLNTTPQNEETDIPTSGKIVLTFNEAVKVRENIMGKLNDVELVPIVNDNTIIFEYTGLEMKKEYTFTMPHGSVMDLAGNMAVEDIHIAFTTSDHPANALLPFGQFSKKPWFAKNMQNPPDDWYQYGFDDSEWETVVGPMARDGMWYSNTRFPYAGKYWFRRHFTMKEVDKTRNYLLYVTHDDDCVVWLNGTEVLRENFYHVSVGDIWNWVSTVAIDGNLLKEGDNVLAVYVHDGGGAAFIDCGLYTDAEVIVEEKGELSLDLSPKRIEENANQPVKLKLTRTGSWEQEETFILTATTDSRVTVPVTITIPAKQSAAVINLPIKNNDVLDADSIVEITATGEGYETVRAQLIIEDDDYPALTVKSSKSIVSEGETFQLTISTSEAVREPLIVTLTCENPKRFTCPMQATIPAGQKSVTVDVTAKDDDVPSETLSNAFIVSAPRYENGEVIVLLEDDDLPVLELTLTPNKVKESDGPVSITGTLRRLTNIDKKITVRLSDDSDGGLYFSQKELILAKGVQQANFSLGPVDNGKVDGDRQYTITAAVWLSSCSCSASGQAAGSVQAQLQVFDDDGPAITLISSQATVREGVTTRLTVTRNTGTEQSLTVRLSSDHDDLLTYNHTLVIPAGQQSAYVEVTPAANDTQNDSQTIVFTAESEGFSSGTCYVLVTDQTLPDATIVALELADSEVEVGGTTTVSVTIKNVGVSVLPARTQTNLHMAGNRVVLLPLYILDPLDPGESVTLTKPLTLDATPGKKSLYAVVNESCEVTELSYLNNSSSPVNVNILPPFKATLNTDKPYYLPGDTITLTGEVRGTDSVNKEVEVYVINDGARQTLEATTDAQGKFVAKYATYSRQMGHYIAGACYPGESLSEPMVEFDVIGLYVNKSFTTCEVNEGDIFNGFINYSNPSNVTLSGVKVETVGNADNCEVSFHVPSTIKAGITGQIPFSLRGKEATEGVLWQKLPILITANDGVRVEHTLYYYVHSPKAQLYSETETIHGSITVGTMREIPITITNRGKGETGIITIKTGADWITSASGLELPSMAYGDSATVVLQFSLPKDAPLNSSLKGTVALNCMSGDGLALDFDMLTVSSETGTLVVDVCDQYTYYSPDKPHLEGATVTVQHPVTQEVMGTGSTDKEGKCSFSLPAGQYRLVVSEPRHETLSYYVLVHPGIETFNEINLGLSGVSIEMVYEETEIEDEYELKTTITYETNVPIPVVEVIMPDSLDIESLGENESLMFNAILTNKGLITALNTRLELPEPFDGITFTSLGEDMFDLAPQQTVVIPVKVTRGSYYANGSRQKRGVKIDFRCKVIPVTYYEEWCGNDHKIHKIPKQIQLRKCGIEIEIDPIDPPEGGGGPSDGPIIIIIPIDPITPGFFSTNESDDCNPCLFNLKHAIPNCGVAALDFLDNARKGGRITKKFPEWFKKLAKKLKDMDFSFTVESALDTANDLVDCHSSDVSPKWKNIVDRGAAYLGSLATLCAIYSLYAEVPSGGTSSYALGVCAGAGIVADVATCLTDIISGCLGGPISVLEGVDQVRAQAVMPSYVEAFGKRLVTILPYYEAQKEYQKELFGKESFLQANTIDLLNLMYHIKMMPEGELLNADSLLSLKPAELSMEDFLMFVERVNNTINMDDGESVSSDNYVHYDKLDESIQKMFQVMTKVEVLGYESVFDMFMNALNELRNNLYEPRNSICAEVTLSIEQKMTMTRQAVRGKLKVYNGNEETVMKDVKLQFVVLDNYGRMAGTDKMEIVPESINGFEGDIDFRSGWTLGPQETGTANILFIPTKHAAPTSPQPYTFTGYISYIDPFTGIEVTKEMAPATLTVTPSPDLELTYLMQRDVYGDDPLTEEVVEPVEPAEFALIINNKGYGEAKNVKILTEQPKIVDNEKGLLIDFQLVSSQVNGEPATLSFGKTIANNFGTIPAHSQAYGQWWLESSLLGHFTSYEVEATHVTNYGNQNLSLIDTVTIHEMTHGFTDATLLSSKPRRGYLVNDIVDADDLPDVVYFTDATQQPLYISTGNIDRLGDSEYMLTATTKQQGWNYGSIADPTGGKLKLASITRSRDGAELPIDNMWQTSRTLRDAREWLYENRLHYVAWLPESGESYLLKFIKDDVVGIDTAEADGEQNGNIHLRMSGGWLTVTGNFHELRSIELYDIRGVKQLATVRQQLGYPVSISSLPSGVYFVRVTTDRGICHAKVLKK